jgi:hypothetical protein
MHHPYCKGPVCSYLAAADAAIAQAIGTGMVDMVVRTGAQETWEEAGTCPSTSPFAAAFMSWHAAAAVPGLT